MKKGFTLIELLVVISIIGVLSSVVLSSLSTAKNKAKLSKAYTTMLDINKSAYICVEGGNSLILPTSGSGGTGGTLICGNEIATLPDISDTGFVYCGNSCGGWYSNSGIYAISIYSDSFPGGRKIVVCGLGYNATGWYYASSPFDFTNRLGCVKDGF